MDFLEAICDSFGSHTGSTYGHPKHQGSLSLSQPTCNGLSPTAELDAMTWFDFDGIKLSRKTDL